MVEQATRKQGRSGALAFLTLRHEVRQDGRLCLTEWQDVVYRPDADAAAPALPPPPAPEGRELARHATDPILLFRYSALTINGHRIHCDADYARNVEGYAGLVVHGPLLAQRLMLAVEAALGGLARFSFRATSALIAGETARIMSDGARFWVAGPDGRQCMIAEAA